MRTSFIAGSVILLLAAGASPMALADGETTIAGKLYADFTVRSTDGNDADDGYGIDVKRFYFGASHKFDDVWSANITTDFHYDSSDGRTSLFVKKAYVQTVLGDMATLRVGSSDLPWIPYVESPYGLRYLENVMVDRAGFGTSSDWGLHLMGKNDVFDYQVSLVNGNGYKNPDRSKSMDIEARVGFRPMSGLTLAVGARSGKLGQDSEGVSPVNTASRVNFLAAWKSGPFNLGAEYFKADNYSTMAVVTGPEDTASGVGVFADYELTGGGKLFARVDEIKPSKDLAPDTKDRYINVGYAFSPRKGVDLAIVYKTDDLEVGGTSTKANEFGIWTQVKF